MKIFFPFLIALIFLSPGKAICQSAFREKLKVNDFVKGLPADLDKNAIVLDKKRYIIEVFALGTDIKDIDKHWNKCLKALQAYPFKYIIVDYDKQDSVADQAKYKFKFYPDKLSSYEIGTDKILTLEEKDTKKHYGLKEQREYGNSKADFSYWEMRYFVKEVKKIYGK